MGHPPIAFPVCIVKPTKKKELATYSRKIEGIQSVAARKLIERLQPYHAVNPADDPLAVVHELDREDKHHTLILIQTKWSMDITIPIIPQFVFPLDWADRNKESLLSELADKPRVEFAPQVAFAQLAGGKSKAVIPTLTQLSNEIRNIVGKFAALPASP